ncbi:MAG: PilZ domain-containing protein [Hyphomicrobiaceae bacterium]
MPRSPLPSERRAFGRRESFIHAFAKLPGRGSEPCIVRNFSDTGALIAFAEDFEVPARFRLVIEAKSIEVMCEVRRRLGDQVGVSFVDAGDTGERLLDEAVPGVLAPTLPEFPPAPARPLSSLLSMTLVTVVPAADVRRLMRG